MVRAHLVVLALTFASGCAESIVGDAVFVCSATFPCGAGETCETCPAESRLAGLALCSPEGADLLARCGGRVANDTALPDTSDTFDTSDLPDTGSDLADAEPDHPPDPPRITVDLLTGRAPLPVIVRADPHHPELESRIDFGDPSAGTHRDGTPKDLEVSPVAAHLYERPGRYTLTVTVRDRAGREAQSTETLEVLEPGLGPPVCLANAAGTPCPGNGTTLVNAFLDVALLQAQAQSSRHILLRRGDRFEAFTTSTPATIAAGELGLLGAYGTSADPPRVVAQQADVLVLRGARWHVSDLAFEGGRAGDAIFVPDASTSLTLTRVAHVGPTQLVRATTAKTSVFATSAGASQLGQGALVDSLFEGPVSATGPVMVTHSRLFAGLALSGPGGPCAALSGLVDSEIRNTGLALDAGPCRAWVSRTLLAGDEGGAAFGGAGAIVSNTIVDLPQHQGGLRLGPDSSIDHITCHQPQGGGGCLFIESGALGVRVFNVLHVAPPSSELIGGPRGATYSCGSCNLRLDPNPPPLASAIPVSPQDFMPLPGLAIDQAFGSSPRRDFGLRCRPAGAGADIGAWERDASPCP